ncbi:hypothetical protein [Prevotella dentasini]|uniref:hypothetical protein n=1 Tax=Prevotella dentasini TaxID=589537 RepID=UPI0011DCCC26|nr:hypothetical protein [Prevotella dentasini]
MATRHNFLGHPPGSSSSIPENIRKDIREEDGWKILYSSVQIIGHRRIQDIADPHSNYLLLYNRYSGILKGFVYIDKALKNNYAYWVLSIPQHTTLFNFSGKFALPANSPDSPQSITLSNITTNNLTHGFDSGWNCFMTELSYDANSMSETLDIYGYAMNISDIKEKGSLDINSKGTIVTSSQSNPYSKSIKGVASMVGDAAKDWITSDKGGKKYISANFWNKIAGSVAKDGISALINFGISKVFRSFLSTTNTTNYDLQFSTTGSVQLTGEIISNSSGQTNPIQGIPLNSIGECLGVWNLAETPKCIESASGELYGVENSYGSTGYLYEFEQHPLYKIIRNPALKTYMYDNICVVNYDCNEWFHPLRKGTENRAWNLKTSHLKDFLYADSTVKIYEEVNKYLLILPNTLPDATSTNNVPSIYYPTCKYDTSDNIAFRIENYLYLNNLSIHSSKTFIPVHTYGDNSARPYRWTYNELVQGGYIQYKDYNNYKPE